MSGARSIHGAYIGGIVLQSRRGSSCVRAAGPRGRAVAAVQGCSITRAKGAIEVFATRRLASQVTTRRPDPNPTGGTPATGALRRFVIPTISVSDTAILYHSGSCSKWQGLEWVMAKTKGTRALRSLGPPRKSSRKKRGPRRVRPLSQRARTATEVIMWRLREDRLGVLGLYTRGSALHPETSAATSRPRFLPRRTLVSQAAHAETYDALTSGACS